MTAIQTHSLRGLYLTPKVRCLNKAFPWYLFTSHQRKMESVLQKVHLDRILEETSALLLLHKMQLLDKEKNMRWVSNCS